ncbi:coiled-coil domain-containing protein [Streptomyces chartreusis]|uniref:hypothetical protein n=1 Tax=Streptomyces chartreusis TaxID=1969 RepID=UPI003628CD3A
MTTPTGGNLGDATITVNANTDPALRALNQFSRDAQGRLRDVRGRYVSEGRLINNSLTTTTRSTNRLSEAMAGLKSASLLLSPALIPVAAQAAPIAAGMGAATVAIGAFAAAAAGQVSAINEAAEAEKTYQTAVKEHGRSSKQAAEAQAAYARQVQEMPPATRTAAAALSSLKTQYQDWSDSLASSTMPVATKSFQTFSALFPKLTPLVQGASGQLNRFVTLVAGGVASPGFDRLIGQFTEFATGALSKANDGLVRFVRTLDTGKVSGGVAQFMEYAKANGPLVRDTLTKIVEALTNVLAAASNVGPGLLTVVNALAGIVAAVPPGAITVMLQLAIAIKAVKLAAAGAAVVTGMTTAVTGMQAAAAGATGVLPRLSAAIATLSRTSKLALAGTGIGLLAIAVSELSQIGRKAPPDIDKMTTSLTRLAQTGKLSGEAARVFGTDFTELGDALRTLSRPSNLDKVQQFLVGWTGWDSTPVKDAKEAFNGLDEGLTSLVKSGKADIAAEALKQATANLKKQGFTAEEVQAQIVGYKESLADVAREQELAAKAQGLFGEQALATSQKLAEQKLSADGLRQAIQALNDVNRQGLSGMIGFEAAIDAATKSAQENAGVLDMQGGQLVVNTDKQRAAAQTLNDLAQKTDEAAAANRESTGSWAGAAQIYERGRQQLLATAQQMGLTRAEAEQLAATILKTPNKTALLKADISDWKSKISEAETQLKTAKGDKRAKLTADIADWKVKVAEAEAQLIRARGTKTAKLSADIGVWTAKIKQAETQLKNAKGEKRARLTADIADLLEKVRRANAALNSVHSRTIRLTTEHRNIYTGSGGRGPNAGGATGGLYTGTGFRYRGQHLAGGGLVDGPGTETSDSIFAGPWVSKNEFVVNAKQTARHLPLLRAINDGQMGKRLGMATGGLVGAGAAAGDGLASGMAGATSTVREAAKAMAAAVVAGIREELQIASPSKRTKALAADVAKGFLEGLTGSQAKIKATATDLVKDIRTAFSGRKESGLVRMVNQQTKKLMDAAKKRDDIAKKIADANKFASDTASQARATGSLASIVQPDAFSPKFVKGEMQASLNAIKAFTSNVTKLQKKGLNKNLLRQILEMGPEQGGAFAKALAGADPATIKQYNSLQANIDKESKKLGSIGADMLYDSGKKAGQGFLTGLKAQQKDIEKLMLNIAKAMQKSIKRALGIKSPSRVMEALGHLTGLGLPVGIKRSLPAIDAAMRTVSAAVVSGAPTTLPGMTAAASVGTLRANTVTASSGDVHVHLHMENRGMIGSQREMTAWLIRSLDDLWRMNRLPRGLKVAS